MKKHLLTALMGTLMVSSAAVAVEGETRLPNDMPPPPPPHEERMPEDMPPPLLSNMHIEKERHVRPPFNEEKRQAEMKRRKEAFINRLNLTEEQKKKAEEIHQKGRAEMEAVMEQMKALHEKAKEIRQKNKTEFEGLLTPEQKKTLEEMNQERKARQEKHFKERGKHLKMKPMPSKSIE